MKKDKTQLIRLQTMIENSRGVSGDGFIQLVSNDLEKVLRDYFVFRTFPRLILERDGNEYVLNINLKINRVKNFTSLSKE